MKKTRKPKPKPEPDEDYIGTTKKAAASSALAR